MAEEEASASTLKLRLTNLRALRSTDRELAFPVFESHNTTTGMTEILLLSDLPVGAHLALPTDANSALLLDQQQLNALVLAGIRKTAPSAPTSVPAGATYRPRGRAEGSREAPTPPAAEGGADQGPPQEVVDDTETPLGDDAPWRPGTTGWKTGQWGGGWRGQAWEESSQGATPKTKGRGKGKPTKGKQGKAKDQPRAPIGSGGGAAGPIGAAPIGTGPFAAGTPLPDTTIPTVTLDDSWPVSPAYTPGAHIATTNPILPPAAIWAAMQAMPQMAQMPTMPTMLPTWPTWPVAHGPPPSLSGDMSQERWPAKKTRRGTRGRKRPKSSSSSSPAPRRRSRSHRKQAAAAAASGLAPTAARASDAPMPVGPGHPQGVEPPPVAPNAAPPQPVAVDGVA